jgi:nucleotide-binding universal stress UspA family protein
MHKLDSQLSGVSHETLIVRSESGWDVVERLLVDLRIDLLIVGTHARTGAAKLLLGSVSVPVLTVGPLISAASHAGARFHRVLYATDFSATAQSAGLYAVSLAKDHQAGLLVLVMRDPTERRAAQTIEHSVADALHRLYEIVPATRQTGCRPTALVRYGDAAEQVLGAVNEQHADLIVRGVRDAGPNIGAATRLGRTVAHKSVAHCPVLTIRP